jgi:hypothetical protein
VVAGAREREAKLDAADDFAFPDLTGLPGVVSVDEGIVELDARYVDTPGLDLVRRGASLRRRTEPGGVRWTLKLPHRILDGVDGADGAGVDGVDGVDGAGADEQTVSGAPAAEPSDASASPGDPWAATVLDRRELELDDPGDTVPPALAGVVSPWVRDLPLVSVARLQTRRHRVGLHGADGAVLVELADDQVTVSTGRQPDGPTTSFREIEAEAHADDDRLLHAVVARLERAGATVGQPVPKVERALGAEASDPPTLPGASPAPGAGTDELVAAVLRARVSALLDAEVVARAALALAGPGTDDGLAWSLGAVLRAERALRATLRGARAVLDDGAADEARTTLRRLAAPLLRAHDAARAAAAAGRGAWWLGPEDRVALGSVLHDVDLEAEAAQHLLAARLGGASHLGHLRDLVDLAERPPLGPTALGGPPPDVGHLAGQAWSRLAAAFGRHDVGARPEPAAVESLRPKLRRAWAMAELAAPTDPAWAERAQVVAPALHRADDVRDLLAVEAMLRSLANGAPRSQVLALGALVGIVRRDVAEAAEACAGRLRTLRTLAGSR